MEVYIQGALKCFHTVHAEISAVVMFAELFSFSVVVLFICFYNFF